MSDGSLKTLPGFVEGPVGRRLPVRLKIRSHIRAVRVSNVALTLFLTVIGVAAEQPPIRRYGLADGLPSRHATCNRRDSHGFMWFCTPEGLSRFDGYTFVNYGVEQGLPDQAVSDILETRRGEYWVGTPRGLAHFNPQSGNFTVVASKPSPRINALMEDRTGTIWVAADEGLFQLAQTKGAWSLRKVETGLPFSFFEQLLEDADGAVWAAAYGGGGRGDALLWRYSNHHSDSWRDPFLMGNRIVAMVQDRQGTLWLSTFNGLAQLNTHPHPGQKLIEHTYAKWNGQDRSETGTLFASSDGRLWVTSEGRYEIVRGPGGEIQFRLLDPTNLGLQEEDGEGNFWAGNTKTVRSGFVRYGPGDGLGSDLIHSIFEGHDGQLYFVFGIHNRYISRFDGKHFITVAPKFPGHGASWDWGGWGWGQIHLQDHNGEWWLATGYGVLRYPKVKKLEDLATTSPKAFYRTAKDAFRLYEDSHGDIWMAAWSGLRRWDRATGQLREADSMSDPEATAFREDRAGNMWIGYWGGGISRQIAGHLQWIVAPGAVPAGTVFSLFLDHAGRMWAGTTRSGLMRIDHPEAEHPQFKTYSTNDGLSSNNVRAITEDHLGRIYFSTSRGVDRLDPDTEKIRRYTEAEGLGPAYAGNNTAYCDRQGRLWFGLEGVSRLDPQPDRPPHPPPIRITSIRIHGSDRRISELGESKISGLVLQPSENQVQIEFASLNFAAGDVIKYQYKLEGADSDWSAPSDLRVVNYPALSAGSYRFLVRAVNADGLLSPVPASVEMRLLPPIWKRWWFLTIAGFLLAAAGYQAYQSRVKHLLALERIRTRIATDLHDDIGASLTQIAIMSEVTRQQGVEPRVAEPLGRIAELSRELVDSMSDIVWAINPQRDNLGDLAYRMQRFASDVLAGMAVDFPLPEQWSDTHLQADVRREVFLVFKEGINNIARHSGCQHVQIRLDLEHDYLVLELADDGEGFQPDANGQGHGLASMRERARRLGADLEIRSVRGKGTLVRLRVPLHAGKPSAPTHAAS